MTIQEQIDALLAEAGPLRSLPPEDQEAAGLRQIVDRINALRALPEDADEADAEPVKRKPGRPAKAA